MKFPFHVDKTQMQIARAEFYLQIEKKEKLQLEIKTLQKELDEVQKEIIRLDRTIFFIKNNK